MTSSDRQSSSAAIRTSQESQSLSAEMQRVIAAPLHARLGNQGLHQLMRARFVQAKLEVSQPNDPLELEADRLARDGASMANASAADSSSVQRMCSSCEEEELSRKPLDSPLKVSRVSESEQAGPVIDESFESAVNSLPGRSCASLPKSVHPFVQRLGVDPSAVRVHMDADLAGRAEAKAFTHGPNIVFNPAHYAPGTPSGDELIRHECVHVAQQGAAVARKIHRSLATPNAPQPAPKPDPKAAFSKAVEELGRELDRRGLKTTEQRVGYVVRTYTIADPLFLRDLIPLDPDLKNRFDAGHDYGFFGTGKPLEGPAESAAQQLNREAAFYLGAVQGRKDFTEMLARQPPPRNTGSYEYHPKHYPDWHEEAAPYFITAIQTTGCVLEPGFCVAMFLATQGAGYAAQRFGIDPRIAEIAVFGIGLAIGMGGLRLPRFGRTPRGEFTINAGTGGGGPPGGGGGGPRRFTFDPVVGDEPTHIGPAPKPPQEPAPASAPAKPAKPTVDDPGADLFGAEAEVPAAQPKPAPKPKPKRKGPSKIEVYEAIDAHRRQNPPPEPAPPPRSEPSVIVDDTAPTGFEHEPTQPDAKPFGAQQPPPAPITSESGPTAGGTIETKKPPTEPPLDPNRRPPRK